MYVRFSAAEQSEVWDRFEAGESMRSIARSIGRSQAAVRDLIQKTGGIRPAGAHGVVRRPDVTGRTGGDLPWARHRAVDAAGGGRTGTGTVDDLARGGRQRRPTSLPGL